MTSAAWQRRSGQITSLDGRAGAARAFLEGARVLALVESEPEAPDVVTVVVATDPEGRVAAVGPDSGAVVASSPLDELAAALAEACQGRVSFGEVVAGPDASSPSADRSDPFDPEIDVLSAYAPDRAIVFTRAEMRELSTLAAAVAMPVLAAPHADGQLVLLSDGPALSTVDWPQQVQPALVVEEGAAYPAVAVVADDAVHLHTWDVERVVVPQDLTGSGEAATFVDRVLGTGALVDAVTGLLPAADPDAVRAAVEGDAAGPDRLVAALGLPRELTSFLAHGTQTPALPGARVHQPAGMGHAFARAVSDAVTDAQAQMSESMREQTELLRERAEQMRERAEHVRERAEQVRERAEAARVRAESAFDAAETFTEEVVVPIRQSWWTPAVAVVEVSLGAVALRRAGRGARFGTGTTPGERVLAVAGGLLLVDAVVNAVVFLAPKLRRDL